MSPCLWLRGKAPGVSQGIYTRLIPAAVQVFTNNGICALKTTTRFKLLDKTGLWRVALNEGRRKALASRPSWYPLSDNVTFVLVFRFFRNCFSHFFKALLCRKICHFYWQRAITLRSVAGSCSSFDINFLSARSGETFRTTLVELIARRARI